MRATWIGTIVLTPLLYIAAVFIFFYILFHEPTRKFDSASWMSDSTKRYQMVDNIIKKKILIGKGPAQVKALLGNATFIYSDSNWSYNMGQGGGGLGFLFHNLSVQFKENKVFKVAHQKIAD